jgi:hypothetical protein
MTFAFADEGEEKCERGGKLRERRRGKDRCVSFGWKKGRMGGGEEGKERTWAILPPPEAGVRVSPERR